MTTPATLLRFSSELAVFLVWFGGFAVVVLRPLLATRPRDRVLVAAGFALVAVAAFLHGSLIVEDEGARLLALRLVGAALTATGTLGWRGGGRARQALWAGLGLVAVASLLGTNGAGRAADVLRLAAAVCISVAVWSASRRSITARITVAAAGTVLLVLVAVSGALSTVLSRNVEDEAERRVQSRAATEVGLATNAARDAILSARFVARPLQTSLGLQLAELREQPARSPQLEQSLTDLRDFLLSEGPVVYVNAAGVALARAGEIDDVTLVALSGAAPVIETLQSGIETSSVEVVAGRPLAIGVYPVAVQVDLEQRLVGAVVATAPLDRGYLAVRTAEDADIALAFVDDSGVLSATGDQPPPSSLRRLGREALGDGDPAAIEAGGRFADAAPVVVGGRPVVAIVASTSSDLVAGTRDDLFRTLFLVAILTALAALVLAAFAGERIGAGLRTLTGAAGGLQRGERGVRAHVTAEDEVGVLADAFNAMAASIEEQADSLVEAAQLEAALRGRLEAVVGGMGEALVAVDTAGRVTTWNAAAEQLVGRRAAQAVDQPVDKVLHLTAEGGDDLARRMRTIPTRAWSSMAMVQGPDDTQVPVAISCGAVRGVEGDPVGAVYVLRDMRREREVERMKTEFLSNISHELRTPLTPIIGYTDMLLNRNVPADKARTFLQGVSDAAVRLRRIVEQLVDFAAIEAGRTVVDLEPVSVRSLASSVAERWQKQTKKHTITTRVARDVKDVPADRRLLERCLDELLDNAVKYSPEGGRITISAELWDHGGRPAVGISVLDEGIGLPEGSEEGLVGDFSQGDGSATRLFGGLGLGLAYAQRVIAAHRGELVLSPRDKKGTSASIVLPIVPMRRAR